MMMDVPLPPGLGRTRRRPASAKPRAQTIFSGQGPSFPGSGETACLAPGPPSLPTPIHAPSASTLPCYASTPGARTTVASSFPTPDSESVKVNILEGVKPSKGAVRFAEPSASASTSRLVPYTPDPSLVESPTSGPAAAAASRRHSTTFIDQSSRRLSSASPALAIKQLKLAFQDTPPMLRQLEDGWRARRSRTLDVSSVSVDKPLKPSKSLLRRARTPEEAMDPYLLEQVELQRRREAKRAASGMHTAPEAHRSPSGTRISSQTKEGQSASHLGQHSEIVDPHATTRPVQLPLTPPTSPPPLPTITTIAADGLAAQGFRLPAAPQRVSEPTHTHAGTDATAPSSPTTETSQLKPISTSCLPPTKHAVPLHKKSTAKITVHNLSHPVSLTLGFQGTTVRVNKTGDEVAISTGPEKQRTRTILRLAESKAWSEEECQYWLRLLSLVDEYKRRTPRVSAMPSTYQLTSPAQGVHREGRPDHIVLRPAGRDFSVLYRVEPFTAGQFGDRAELGNEGPDPLQ